MSESQQRAHAPTCSRCGEEAEFEIVETFMGLDVLGPGEPVCALCAHASGLPELDRSPKPGPQPVPPAHTRSGWHGG